jgi:hypothetical protein
MARRQIRLTAFWVSNLFLSLKLKKYFAGARARGLQGFAKGPQSFAKGAIRLC